jgi:hypothetical protein
MSAFRLAPTQVQEPPRRRPQKRSDYLAWVHTLPCCVTGRNDIQAAHLSFASPWHGHYGRAKGTKAPDRFALPLCQAEHARQHSMNERAYWDSVGINPHELANTLFGIFNDYDEYEATQRATARIMSGLASIDRLPTRDLA